MNCPTCGRFMKLGGYYTNDHDDSWEETWRCTVRHPTEAQKARVRELVEEARRENDKRERTEIRAIFAAVREQKGVDRD